MSGRRCAFCRGPMSPRRSEWPSAFAKRVTCSKSCGNRLAGSVRRGALDASDPERRCGTCGEALIRKRKEQRTSFHVRMFCSPACSNRARGIGTDDGRVCDTCRGPLLRRAGESATNWRKRKTCGGGCLPSKAFEIHGVSLSTIEIAQLVGIGKSSMFDRIRKGLPILAPSMKPWLTRRSQ